jgi:hypothetical protein
MTSNEPTRPPASPPCFAGEADPAYMGYFANEELAERLNVLLEAERAGVRVAMVLDHEATNPDLKAIAAQLRRDEAHWCQVLSEALGRLGAQPSTKVGDFYEKVMAIEGFEARLAFVNRGQAWVARKVRELLPKVADDGLHTELRAMLEGHDSNIALAEQALARAGGDPPSAPKA